MISAQVQLGHNKKPLMLQSNASQRSIFPSCYTQILIELCPNAFAGHPQNMFVCMPKVKRLIVNYVQNHTAVMSCIFMSVKSGSTDLA